MHSPAVPRIRASGVVSDAVQLIALVWLVPFAILVVGAPIALIGAALVWLARLGGAQ